MTAVTWASPIVRHANSQELVLKLKPNDADAIRNRADALARKGK